ncbi:MAG: oligosaccharide flippase family protein, partial [Salibacteraceae bacterium]
MLENLRSKIQGRSGQLVVAQSLSTLLLFAVDVVFARIFSVELFGSWKQILLISNFLLPLASFGVIDGFKYFAARESSAWKEHYSSVSLLLGMMFLVLLLANNFFDNFLFIELLGNTELATISIIFPFIYIFYSLATLAKFAAINVRSEAVFKNGMIISLVLNFLVYAAVYLNYKVLSNREILILLALGLVMGHFVRYAYVSLKLNSYKSLRMDWSSVRGYFQYGLPLYLTSFISIIVLNTDKTIVSVYAGVTGFAIYSVGAKEIPFLGILSSSVYQSVFPRLVEAYRNNDARKAIDLWASSTIKVSQITYPLILVLMIISRPAVVFLYGDQYEPAVRIFQTYLLVLFWRNNYYGALLSASGKTNWIMLYGLLTMLVNIALSIIFYQMFGTIGVVYGT